MKHALVLCLALAACRSKTSNPSPSPKQTSPSASTSAGSAASTDPCEHVAEGVKAIWDRQVFEATDDATRKAAATMRDKAVARLQRHCREDGWSAEAAECIRGGSPCPGKLTPAQQQKLQADDLNKEAP
ncbi:MAG: hypothetical protein ACM31C_07695 [Acidobacteriota bacterium]